MNLDLLYVREFINKQRAKAVAAGRSPKILDRITWIAEALEPGASVDLVERAKRGLDMSAIEAQDNQDGTFATRPPPPQSTQIQAVVADGSVNLWQHEEVPLDTNLTWDGESAVFHEASNATLGFPVWAQSRDGSVHSVTITTTGFAGATVKLGFARYKKIKLLSYFGAAPYSELLLPQKVRTTNSDRSWLSRAFSNRMCPDQLDDGGTADVPSTGSQTFWVDVILPKGVSGTVSGVVHLTHSGGVVDLPVDIVVRGAELTDANPKPNLIFLAGNLGERVVGDLYENVGSANYNTQMQWLKEASKVLREHGADPVFTDTRDATNGLPTPVPDADRIEILDGSLYAGEPWRGAIAHSWDICGIYGDIQGYSGYSAADAAGKQTILNTLHGNRRTALSTAGLGSLIDFHYTNDEGTFAAANEVAESLQGIANPLPMATFDTTVDQIVEKAIGYPGDAVVHPGETFDNTNTDPTRRQSQGAITAEADKIKVLVGAGHVITRATKRIYEWFRGLGNYAAMYNGQNPLRGSVMIEEDPHAIWLNSVVDYTMGNNIWFGWSAALYYHVEYRPPDYADDAAEDTLGEWKPTTGPNAGTVDPKRQNIHRFAHTFGKIIDRDGLFNRGSGRAGNGDGVLLFPKDDQHYADDPWIPNTFGFFVSLRLKHFRECFQIENLIYLAAAADATATNTLVESFYPWSPFRVGAGVRGEGLPLGVRSHVENTDAETGTVLAQRFQDQKTGSDIKLFKRALFDIIEA